MNPGSEVGDSVVTRIRKIVRFINLESKKIQAEYGISIPQLLCLNYLNEAPDYSSNTKEIRSFLNLNSSTATGIINRLEKKGLIARLPGRDDKRVTLISLTSKGLNLIQKIPPLAQQNLDRKLARLPKEKLALILTGLDELIKILEIVDLDASPVLTTDHSLNPNNDNNT